MGEAAVATRTIQVGIAVSPSFKSIPGWKEKFNSRLAYASQIFEREFKIKFKANAFWDWKAVDDNQESHFLVDKLVDDFPLHGVDIVIGLTRLSKLPTLDQIKDLHVIGRTRPFSGYLVIRYPNDPLFKVQEETVLVHELGHLFGAVHTDDPESIMSPIVERQLPTRFDNTNRDILMMTRNIDFKKGVSTLDPKTSQQLLASYLRLSVLNQPLEFYYSLGVFYINLGKYEDAANAWEKAASMDADNPLLNYDLGMLYLKVGNYKKAIPQLSRAVSKLTSPEEKSKKAAVLNALGEAYMKDGSFVSSYDAFNRALAINPNDPNAKLNIALIKLKQGQVETAIKELRILLVASPDNPKILGALGRAYSESGQYAEALDYLKRALEMVKKQGARNNQAQIVELYNHLGHVYQAMKNDEQAVNYFQLACQIVDSAECHQQLGQIYFRRTKWENAIQEFAAVLQTRKEDADVYGAMGVALSQVGKNDQAIAVFNEGIRYVKDNMAAARLHANLGYVYLQQGHPDFSEKEFRIAISKNWQNVEAHMGLAMANAKRNNFIAAKQELETVLQIKPNHQKARSLLNDIKNTLNKSSSM